MFRSLLPSKLFALLALLGLLAVPVGLYALSCQEQANEIYELCLDQGENPADCHFNSIIAYCNCMGIICVGDPD